MSNYLNKFKEKVEEIQKEEYSEIIRITEENLNSEAKRIAIRLIRHFGCPQSVTLDHETMTPEDVEHDIRMALMSMLREEPNNDNEVHPRCDDHVDVFLESPRIRVNYETTSMAAMPWCTIYPFTMRANNSFNDSYRMVSAVHDLYHGPQFEKMRFWGGKYREVNYNEAGEPGVTLDWRFDDDYGAFRKLDAEEIVGVDYIGSWAWPVQKSYLRWCKALIGLQSYEEIGLYAEE